MQCFKYNSLFVEAIRRTLVAILALLILNGSVDTIDPISSIYWNGEDYVEDKDYNDVESIYELVTEEMLDLEDFVPEHDNDAGDVEKQVKTTTHWIALHHYPDIPVSVHYYSCAKTHYPEITSRISTVFLARETPPPDSVAHASIA
ncbi:MAG: hypothetical protein EOP56_16460 [Sphingobacteriales bacterium]|nr:MAG: hypothetical protein EOP56_16460 [Sphingobacteriales bacterium]